MLSQIDNHAKLCNHYEKVPLSQIVVEDTLRFMFCRQEPLCCLLSCPLLPLHSDALVLMQM